MTRPYVTSYTLTCAAGTGLDAVRAALRESRCGLRRNDFPHCDLDTWIGRVDGVESVRLPDSLAHFDCRNNRLALLGLQQDDFDTAVRAAIDRHGASRVACITGTSTGGIGATEDAFRHGAGEGSMPEAYRLPRVHNPHTTSAFTAGHLGLEGPVYTLSTACSSSAKVFASAARLMDLGWIDAAVVGGVDSLCNSVLYGFHALELVSPEPCRPFDRHRNGLNLGEAAGFALLERRGGTGAPRLLGAGESSDAWHMSSPHPEGAGAAAAMRGALESAGLEPGDIGYLNLHGTATPLNDRTEAGVVAGLVPDTPCSSTKGWTGHTLGGAGITESVISLLALADGLLPGTLGCDDPEDGLPGLLTGNLERRVGAVMTNSFGFGGSNCTLVFGHE